MVYQNLILKLTECKPFLNNNSSGYLGLVVQLYMPRAHLGPHIVLYTRSENVMLVGLATQTSKKQTNKCVDGLTHYLGLVYTYTFTSVAL